MRGDYLSPELVDDGEALRKVEQSTISLTRLVEGRVRPDQIARAFSPLGCGAALIKLDAIGATLYEDFYRLQWQLCTRALENDATLKETAIANFAALDRPVRQLLLCCGLGVARTRKARGSPVALPQLELEKFCLGAPLSATLGRPLAADRQEFHPSVEWLIEQDETGSLGRDETPSYAVVADLGDHAGGKIMGRTQADETRLLALYREWKDSTPEERCGHGHKYNGDVYYGAFRGHTHIDGGATMTVLFGAGDLRDRDGFAVDGTVSSRELGGTLMVASPGEEQMVALPYRLPCGAPYVVVFFENFVKPSRPAALTPTVRESDCSDEQKTAVARQLRRHAAVDTNSLGWASTVHGVRRIANEGFSRGQTVVHVIVTEDDLA